MTPVYAFALALAVAALLTPIVIFLARRLGWVVAPRQDRWHRKPTAIYGGAAIYLAFVAGWLALGARDDQSLVLVGCASAMFVIGLIDDIFEMKAQVKFLAQLLVATVAVALGLSFDLLPWPWLNVPFTLLWLVGVTNAINILDNMDGLSSGVALSAGMILSLVAVLRGMPEVGLLSAALAGAAGGFLIYNFNPAKIFMGDCGSLFLGFSLAGCTVLGAGGASNLVLALLIPVGVLAVPLFDTALVSFQRTSHGRSIAQGGRDHSSHRLVFLGLSERKAVLILITVSLAGGLLALFLQFLSSLVAVVVIAVVAVVFVFFGVFLGGVRVYGPKELPRPRESTLLGQVILYKKQLVQILTDLLLLSAAYTAAWLLRFEGHLGPQQMTLLTQSLPWVLAAKIVCLWIFGVYRGEWRYVSVYAMIQLAKAVLLGSLLMVLGILLLLRGHGYSLAAVIIDFFVSFLFLAGSRFLVRAFTESMVQKKGEPVLIMGAGDGGELLLRELRNNSALPYSPVGFVDDDPAKRGLLIHGVPVLGTRHDIPGLARKHGVVRVFISILSPVEGGLEEVFTMCRQTGVECVRIQPIVEQELAQPQ
ncbi:MAG: hypothetical protein KQI62_14535 [Deltaproteobacteria bacterium]|nr:hypothetical protein [Deltaproteobacteria bacterium]